MTTTIETNIIEIPFHGDVLHAVEDNGDIWLAVRPACEAIGIDFKGQHKKLQRNAHRAVVVKMTTTGSDGKRYEMLMLHRKSVPWWLTSIETRKVKNPATRKKLELYQTDAAEVLNEHYWGLKTTNLPAALPAELISGLERLAGHQPAGQQTAAVLGKFLPKHLDPVLQETRWAGETARWAGDAALWAGLVGVYNAHQLNELREQPLQTAEKIADAIEAGLEAFRATLRN